jgi:uncharacterized membrane protein
MTKGKYGITLAAVAALAFILALFNFTEVLVLVVGYAIIAEGNNWLTKQTLQALFLKIGYSIALVVVQWIPNGYNTIYGKINIFNITGFVNIFNGFLTGALGLIMLIFCIIAFFKIIKGQDANLPIFGDLADRAMGIFKAKTVPNYAQQTQYTQNTPAPQYTTSSSAQQTTSAEWKCACGKMNTEKFCSVCGSKNPNIN